MMSCVDCSDEEFTVYRWNGNEFDFDKDEEDPSDELWTIESDTFEEWLMVPNVSLEAK